MRERPSISKETPLGKAGNGDERDAEVLENMGIRPSEMKRSFNVWSLLFMSFCTSVTWEAVSSVVAQALTSGGCSSFVWGFVASAAGAMLIVSCHGEYASMIPTAGGQYHYVAEMSPMRYRRIFSWYAGWLTMIGWVLCATAGTFAGVMQIQSWIILFKEDYVYERWHTSLIFIAFTTYYSITAIFQLKYLHHMIFLAMFAHIVGYLATPIYLLVNVEKKNTATYVFTDFTNLSGWESPGISWSIGLLTSAIGFVNWDSALHMAEEMKNASKDLPRTILVSVFGSAVLTFPWIIAFAFCITDIQGVLSGPVGLISPMAQLFYNVSGGNQAATIGLTIFLPLMSFCGTGQAVISSTSRVVWAFARDGGLPDVFAKVGDRTKVPTNAIILTWAINCAISLIYIGNATAYYGISSACTVALILSYAFPLFINVVWGFEHCAIPRGAFSLGRFHRPVAAIALVWCVYLTVFLCFPTYYPVSKDNMNYASVVIIGGTAMATMNWFLYGKSHYVGTTSNVEAH
ncbi:unnamed protein product [Clonostachys rosea]|uniref:Amino acid permease/ SLC12A domain-containing protein n=1 Tax=Bionectria ochroleuca TaxID=29856 RepID=A0ABY6UIT8_BIOOC|nr:unnamed protein product [Clonostachys rosea]